MGAFTICWDCKKATTGECSWSKNLKPVDGWKAKKNKKRVHRFKMPGV